MAANLLFQLRNSYRVVSAHNILLKRCSCRSRGKECSIGCDCINCTNTQEKGNEDLLNIVVDEYLAELNDKSTGVPDDANDIMDWVFGDEVFERDEDFEGDENFIDNELSDSEH